MILKSWNHVFLPIMRLVIKLKPLGKDERFVMAITMRFDTFLVSTNFYYTGQNLKRHLRSSEVIDLG